MSRLLSRVALSNLFTMGVSAREDDRQAVPGRPATPDARVRCLRARLILEEALETIEALGFAAALNCGVGGQRQIALDKVQFIETHPPEFAEIIDGCCDVIYVAVGTLCVLGVPDLPHLEEVCRANDAKFPGGKGITNEHGKFLKPEGWQPPNHIAMMERAYPPIDFPAMTWSLLQTAEERAADATCRPGG